MEELPGLAVEDVVEGVPVGGHHQLARLAFPFGVQQHLDLVGVPVMRVVGRELEVPDHLPGVGIEGEQAVRVEVVAGADVAVPVGRRVADGPVEQIEFGIVGAGEPGGPAAGLPAVAAPGLAPGLPGRGDGVGAPRQLAGRGVVGVEVAAHTGLRPGHAHDHLVLDHQRGQGEREPDRVVAHFDVPANGAGARVEGNQVCVERTHEHRRVEHRDPPVHFRKPDVEHVRSHLRRPGPDPAPGARVEGAHGARGLGHVQDAVHGDGRGLDDPVVHLIGPQHPEVAYVGAVDPVQPGVAVRRIVAGIGQPVVGFGVGVDDALEGNPGLVGRAFRDAAFRGRPASRNDDRAGQQSVDEGRGGSSSMSCRGEGCEPVHAHPPRLARYAMRLSMSSLERFIVAGMSECPKRFSRSARSALRSDTIEPVPVMSWTVKASSLARMPS